MDNNFTMEDLQAQVNRLTAEHQEKIKRVYFKAAETRKKWLDELGGNDELSTMYLDMYSGIADALVIMEDKSSEDVLGEILRMCVALYGEEYGLMEDMQ